MDALDDGAAHADGCLEYIVKAFICVALASLIGLHVCSHFMGPPVIADGDLADIKSVVTRLRTGLHEMNEKHEQLATSLKRITSTLSGVRFAAYRAKVATDSKRDTTKPEPHVFHIFNYDYQPDFALESAGGRVVDTGDTVEYPRYESAPGMLLSALSALVCHACHGCDGARLMLRPGTLPGECWAFSGERGEAIIQLLGFVIVSGISVQHIPASVSPSKEISSAPRSVQLEGLEVLAGDAHPHDFGTFQYELEGQPIQYFPVTRPTAKPYRLVRFRVLTNWGNQKYTCVYRLRVHGNLAPGQGDTSAINSSYSN